jgi:hypothetical protein
MARARGKTVVHVLHIGKTGGTALEHMLTHTQPGSGFHLVLHGHPVTLADVPAGDKVVLFVRDPIARFKSGFWSRFRKGRPRYNVPWNETEARAFGEFPTPNDLGAALSDDDSAKRQRAREAMTGIRHVSDHYGRWLKTREYLSSRAEDIMLIGWTETLDADSRRLVKLLGMPESASLPTDPTAAHRNPTELDQELSETAQVNLRTWYAEDYDLLDEAQALMSRRFVEPEAAAANARARVT